jgi:putative CocE/NonD family hydrolase
LASAKSTKYYLHSAGKANGAVGDGQLSSQAPAAEPTDSYVYDPANPVATIGGPLCCDWVHLAPGPRDQRTAEERSDVLVYTTPAFVRDTEVTGPVSLDLFASTSAKDTDFTAKLVDLWPNGFAQNLTEGILRLRYRNSMERPELAKPGEIYHVAVGHQQRLSRRPPPARGNFQQQFSALRPQPQHRGGPGNLHENAACHQHHLSRQRAPLSPGASDCSVNKLRC